MSKIEQGSVGKEEVLSGAVDSGDSTATEDDQRKARRPRRGPAPASYVTVRLGRTQYQRVKGLASKRRVSVAECVKTAIDDWISARGGSDTLGTIGERIDWLQSQLRMSIMQMDVSLREIAGVASDMEARDEHGVVDVADAFRK